VRTLADLWAGRLPLRAAFWIWGVAVGGAVNLAATAGSMSVLAAGLPAPAALAMHLLPLPYNIAIAVGVWRSAGQYEGPQLWADLARVGAVALAAGLTLI
jgi:hypothetical protein